jgi:hypothetical protein
MIRSVMVAVVLARTCPGAVAQELSAPAAAGPEGGKAQFEMFLDFSDDASGRLSVVIDALAGRYPQDVWLVFRHLPPPQDLVAGLPHRAALAAGRQGKFWEMARVLFANQERSGREDLLGMAAQIGLDMERFTLDLDDVTLDNDLDADRARAADVKIARAPALLLNGVPVTGERTLKRLDELVRDARVPR